MFVEGLPPAVPGSILRHCKLITPRQGLRDAFEVQDVIQSISTSKRTPVAPCVPGVCFKDIQKRKTHVHVSAQFAGTRTHQGVGEYPLAAPSTGTIVLQTCSLMARAV